MFTHTHTHTLEHTGTHRTSHLHTLIYPHVWVVWAIHISSTYMHAWLHRWADRQLSFMFSRRHIFKHECMHILYIICTHRAIMSRDVTKRNTVAVAVQRCTDEAGLELLPCEKLQSSKNFQSKSWGQNCRLRQTKRACKMPELYVQHLHERGNSRCQTDLKV